MGLIHYLPILSCCSVELHPNRHVYPFRQEVHHKVEIKEVNLSVSFSSSPQVFRLSQCISQLKEVDVKNTTHTRVEEWKQEEARVQRRGDL